MQVITAFITHGGRVFLIRRSERVGTYRGAWAAVSGYVERLPIVQARLEIAEEAGLGPEDLRLRGIGVPVPIDDPHENRHWLVFPFLFETDRPERIPTDWEAAESQWVEPDQIEGLRTVPGLAEVRSAVWPPFGGSELWQELETVATDTARGSTDLALAGLDAVAKYADPDDARRAALAFAACRPAMGAFPNLAARVIAAVEDGEDHREVASRLASEVVSATGRSAERASSGLAGTKTILTHSRSRAVQETILAWARVTPGAEVIVTESRPGLEGVGLASDLAKSGLRVTLITDAQMSHFIPQCGTVLVGCDAITPAGESVNKAGTRLAVLAARAAGVPAYCVAQTFKIVPQEWPEVVEEQEPADVYETDSFRVRNVIFDRTPMAEFEAVIGEKGIISPVDHARLSHHGNTELRKHGRGMQNH